MFGVVVQLENKGLPVAGGETVGAVVAERQVTAESQPQLRPDQSHCRALLVAKRVEGDAGETVQGPFVDQAQRQGCKVHHCEDFRKEIRR